MSDQPESSSESNQIHQNSTGDRNQTIGQIYGGLIVYGNVNVNAPATPETKDSESSRTLGPNPYKGLLAFHESDSDRYFGRSEEIQILWERFRDLHELEGAVRLLPIYGPSGSGKSSLARAGLLPELGKRPIPGRDRARVAVLVPGTQPLQSLAAVLARIADNDPSPARKTREFTNELSIVNKQGKFDGLQRIASVLPDISTFPLIVLIDQFEEVYSQCRDTDEQNQFIANLLHAASDHSRYVSVIITFRSDFLRETHRHPKLNRLFSQEGFLVPTMDQDSLREAITRPAQDSGYSLSAAIVDLLIQETEGGEGSLPLLQVVLSRIWENLPNKEPAQTLREVGGVGGALVDEAERIYTRLTPEKQAIARRMFLGLVQLGEGIRDTRRRVAISKLVAAQDNPNALQSVIRRFASQTARLVTLNEDNDFVIAEVTHEALLERWPRLKNWLANSRDDLRFQRRLEEATQYWNAQGQPKGSLWRSPDLDFLETFVRRANQNASNLQLTATQLEFYQASQKQKEEERWVKQRRLELEKKYARLIGGASLTVAILSIAIAVGSLRIANQRKTIESVFLGTNTQEIVEALPAFEASADQLKQTIDTLPDEIEPQSAIAHYQKHKEKFKKLFAYYRNLLTVTGKINRETRLDEIERLKRVEHAFGALLNKYRVPELQLNLEQDEFSKYLDEPGNVFENQYSEGAVKTTYEILMTSSGAGADLNKDGFIEDVQEASQMPCITLQKIEELWREATNRTCGWHSSEGHYLDDGDCNELDDDRNTLYAAVFDFSKDDAITRIKEDCKIPPG